MMALVAQAFGAARKAEIDWRDLYEVMLNGSGNSGVLRKMVAPALDGDFDGYRFSIANAAKDIGYFKSLASGLGAGNYTGGCRGRRILGRACQGTWPKERKPPAGSMTSEAQPLPAQPISRLRCAAN